MNARDAANPVAQAIARQLGTEDVEIESPYVYVAKPGEAHTTRYEMSYATRQVNDAFDRDETEPVPGRFHVELLPPDDGEWGQ